MPPRSIPGAATTFARHRSGSFVCRGSRRSSNAHSIVDGEIVFKNACALCCEGIVAERFGSPYRWGRLKHWLEIKNPARFLVLDEPFSGLNLVTKAALLGDICRLRAFTQDRLGKPAAARALTTARLGQAT